MFHSSLFRMAEERERIAPMEYIKADKVSFAMFLLRVFTLFASVMAIINPYRCS